MKTARADEPEGEGISRRARIEGDDEDVEGHVKQATRRAVDDEDVEGHGMPMRSPSSRGE